MRWSSGSLRAFWAAGLRWSTFVIEFLQVLKRFDILRVVRLGEHGAGVGMGAKWPGGYSMQALPLAFAAGRFGFAHRRFFDHFESIVSGKELCLVNPLVTLFSEMALHLTRPCTCIMRLIRQSE